MVVCAPGFECDNEDGGVGNLVIVGQTLQSVNFCGGNLDGQLPEFFVISTQQRLACTDLIENGPFGFSGCAPIPPP